MNLFSSRERDAVEDKYCDTPVYEMAEDVCSRCLADCRSFSLHPSELLYLAFYIIDTIRGYGLCHARRFVDRCYDEHMAYLRHDKQTGASEEDLHTAVTMTLHTAVQWMLDSGQSGWLWVARSLERQIAERHGEGLVDIARSFAECTDEEYEEDRRQYMQRYMNATTLISEEIDNMLDSLEAAVAGLQGKGSVYVRELVLNKNVENEIGNVETGAVGVQHNHSN